MADQFGIPEMERRPHVRCEFYEDHVVDQAATQLAGHPVYKVKERVRMGKIGGNGQTADELISWVKTHAELWPSIEPQYRAWKAGLEEPVTGTALEMWPAIQPRMVAMLKLAHIRTVEELADLQDNQLYNIGMGGRELRDKAIRWLQASRDIGQTAEQLAARDAELTILREQLAELTEIVKAQRHAPPRRRGRPPRKVPAIPREDDLTTLDGAGV